MNGAVSDEFSQENFARRPGPGRHLRGGLRNRFPDRSQLLTERNILGLLQSVVTIGIVACTMMFCLASRDFDLSVGSTVAFTGMIAVIASNMTGSIVMGLIIALLSGALVGAVNGFVIACFRINALITTLATMQTSGTGADRVRRPGRRHQRPRVLPARPVPLPGHPHADLGHGCAFIAFGFC